MGLLNSLFGRKKYSFDEAFTPYQRAPGDNTYDLPQDPVAPLASQYQPGYFQGGDHFGGRDALSLIAATIADTMKLQRGMTPDTGDGMFQGRLSAIAMAKKKAEQDAQRQALMQAAQRMNISPDAVTLAQGGLDGLMPKAPEPTEQQRNFEAWQHMTPEQQAQYGQYQDIINPRFTNDAQGTKFVPRTSLPHGLDPNVWEPVDGGPTQPASGTFPPRRARPYNRY